MISDNPELGELFNPGLPYTKAEIIWICRNEMPLKLEDILARRTRALFLDTKISSKIAPEIAGIMAKELNFTKEWAENQIKEYNQLILNYL